MSGLTSAGFEPKTQTEIEDEIAADQRALVSPTIDTSRTSPVGKLNQVHARQLAEVWTQAQKLYRAFFVPGGAEGYALTMRAGLTGTEREAASYSRVTATCTLAPGTYAAGALLASVDGDPTARFRSLEAATNSGDVAADVDVVFVCDSTGPVRANAGTLTVIAQATAGWTAVTNASDAELGAAEETDEALDARRVDELRFSGSTTLAAIRADILNGVPGVSSVAILENDTRRTGANGVPGHSLECIVLGPTSPTADDNQAVAEQIQASKSAAVGTYGNTTRTVALADGTTREISFTRPTIVQVYVEVELTVDPDTYAGDTAVQEAIADSVADLDPGEVVRARVVAAAVLDVAGVTDIVTFGMSTAPGGPFLDANITPTVRQVVRIDSGDVTVTT